MDLDFADGDGATEWVRWHTATAQALVCDDGDKVNQMLQQIVDGQLWDPAGSSVSQDTLDSFNDELDFRAQDGTTSNRHAGGARAADAAAGRLAHRRLGRLRRPAGARRRRHAGHARAAKEWHRVNCASTIRRRNGTAGPSWGCATRWWTTFVQTDAQRRGELRRRATST